MSLHANTAEIELLLRRQQRRSTILSVIIGILVVALLMVIMALILLTPLFKETPTIVTYRGTDLRDDQIDPRKTFNQLRSTPSAPSSAMSRVIAANTASPTAIPVPEFDVEAVSEAFGTGDDFGDGWSGGGDGWGGGGTSFFKQSVQAQRVAYVIDFSASMKKDGRESLMRRELSKSVEKLVPGMTYQMVFFAGPAWVAGDEVTSNQKAGTVKSGKQTYKWDCPSGKAHDWNQKGEKQVPEWVDVSSLALKKSVKHIEGTKLVWGTFWEPALEMAMAMEPPPQVIFFMTDGVTGGDTMALVRKIGARAKSRGIMINTVAMMEPKAEAAMKDLAKRTGGQFSIVKKGGKVEVVPAK